MMQGKIDKLAQWILAAKHIVAFTGAGISTPSGIPDFRSPDCGLWDSVDPMRVASIHGFRKDPAAFYAWVRPLTQTTLNARPNPAHEALFILEQQGKLKSVITQNIDMLHGRSGHAIVHELHGHLREATCIHCFTVYDNVPIMQRFLEDGKVPRCPSCAGVLKPNVILFGEQLPYEVFKAAQIAATEADLMLVIGSSLEVAPASDIPILAQRTGAKIAIINKEPTDFDARADLILRGDAAILLPEIVHTLETIK